MDEKIYNYRYVAQVTIEATTPIRTVSGKSDIFIDSPVLKDWNGLPMILGSSIAGVLRHSFDKKFADRIFGFEKEKEDKGFGSRIIVSNAHMCDENGFIHQELGLPQNDFLNKYHNLPVREHTAIDEKGVAKNNSKFDEEVVFAGTRFKFELEFLSDKDEESKKAWNKILDKLSDPLFRLGAGSTKGFGKFKVVECFESSYEMGVDYDEKPSDLNKKIGENIINKFQDQNKSIKYVINLEHEENFFIFGAGFGDDEVDDIAVTEEIVEWNKEGKAKFSKQKVLFPASSLKGALSHRIAFHYNRLNKIFADKVKDIKEHIGSNNKAVSTIFGAKKGDKNESKGLALFSDMYEKYDESKIKIFDHVKIDRFTGGAVEGALFNEKVIADDKITWQIEIVLSKNIEDKQIIEAFEATLDDLARGWLPLGGKVNRGHGVFISPNSQNDGRGWYCNKGDKNAK